MYRLNNFQQSMQTKEEVKRKQITMGLSRRAVLNKQIQRLQGEIRDASQGLNVIESRCNVTSASAGPTKTKSGAFAGHDFKEGEDSVKQLNGGGAASSEVQIGFNRFHNVTPLIPNSPVSITSNGTARESKGCRQGKTLYVAMISNNINRLGNYATFNNKSQRWSKFNTETRTKKNSLRMRKPDGQNYDCIDINYKSPQKFEFQKQADRIN